MSVVEMKLANGRRPSRWLVYDWHTHLIVRDCDSEAVARAVAHTALLRQ